jgi:hypothetical protein
MTVAPTSTQKKDPIKKLQQDVGELRTRIATLESERPGRKPKPLLAIKEADVCAIDPDSDSTTCPYSSIYRYQSGCWGTRCRQKQHEAYERRKLVRSNGKASPVKPVKAVKSPAKAPVKAVKTAPSPPPKKTVKKITKKVVPATAAAPKAPAKRAVKRLAS